MCSELHTECCWEPSQLGCVACSHGVAPEEFCGTADAIDHPEACLTGADCCVEAADEACAQIHFPRALGMGFTTDYTAQGTTYSWSQGECFIMSTMCCHATDQLECVACQNNMQPDALCSERGEEFPEVCIVIGLPPPPTLINPAECCVESPPAECSTVDFPLAVGDGITTDFTQVGVTYSWSNHACFESHTACCWDQTQVGCVACSLNVLPENFCDSHSSAYPEFCLTGDECCTESPPLACSNLHFAHAVGMGFTSDHTQTGKTFTWTHNACHEQTTMCCQSTDLIECVACTNGVQPGDFCDELGDDFPQLCSQAA